MKKKVYIPLAAGFEEAEAIVPADILRRAGIDAVLVSVTGQTVVCSAHGVRIVADSLLAQTDMTDGDMIFLPGGMPGAQTLSECAPLAEVISAYRKAGKWLAAICAAPMVYGQMGLLRGRKATCYPGFESKLLGAELQKCTVVCDDGIITGCGPGAGFALGRALVAALIDPETADGILRQMMFEVYE